MIQSLSEKGTGLLDSIARNKDLRRESRSPVPFSDRLSKVTPKLVEPLLHCCPGRARCRHRPQRLQMPARPAAQTTRKMVRAIALAAEHAAVGIEEQLDRVIAVLTLEDA